MGDPVYGRGGRPMLLHAWSLRLERAGKRPIEAEATLPPTFFEAGFGEVGLSAYTGSRTTSR